MIILITRRVMQKILKKQNEMIFLIIRTLTGTQEHIIYLNMKYGNRVENKGQTRSLSFKWPSLITGLASKFDFRESGRATFNPSNAFITCIFLVK